MNKEQEEVILIDFTFEHLEECTSYFYDEYGKFVLVQKKSTDKKMIKLTKKFLHKQFIYALKCVKNFLPTYNKLDECTEFYYNEYGKLNCAKKDLNNKKLYKYIQNFLRKHFKEARNAIKKQNKEMLSKSNIKAIQGFKTSNKPQIETKTKQLELSLNKLLEGGKNE